MIERNIDYLQMNVLLNESDFNNTDLKPISAVRFYKRGYVDGLGVRYYFGNPNSKRALVVVSGGSLEAIRGRGVSDGDILERYLNLGSILTRIDLAITDYIEDDFCTVDMVKSWVKTGQVRSNWVGHGSTSLSKMNDDGSDRLETFYVGEMGSRGKRGIFRAYDKGLQSGLDAEIITRLEVELRKDKAHNTAKRVVKTGDIGGNFRTSFDCDNEEFERLVLSPCVAAVRGQGQERIEEDEKMSKRWDWLINQVAPALNEAVEYERVKNPSQTNLLKFLVAAGVMEDVREFANSLANRKYYDMMFDNEIEPDETGGK